MTCLSPRSLNSRRGSFARTYGERHEPLIGRIFPIRIASHLAHLCGVVAPFAQPLKAAKVYCPRGNLAHGDIEYGKVDQANMRIALYQPDIPQNTGTILRLAACLDVAVDIIGPAGFDLGDKTLKRAGLDYLEYATLTRHESWAAYQFAIKQGPSAGAASTPRLLLLSAHATTSYLDITYRSDDILLFGRESAGVPDAVHTAADARLRIPIREGLRSLNLAVAVAMVTGEALRQTRGLT